MLKNILLLFITLSFLQCAVKEDASDPPADPITTELEQLIREYYQVMSDRDWSAYAGYFTDRAVLTTVWQVHPDSLATINVNTISEFVAKTKDGPDSQPIFEEIPNTIEVSRRGAGLASAWAHYDAKFGTEEELMTWSGYDLFSFIQYNGKWKIASLTFASEE